MNYKERSVSDPTKYTRVFGEKFRELSRNLRRSVPRVDDPKARALFEVSAEVIDGLEKAFNDYEEKNEEAWEEV